LRTLDFPLVCWPMSPALASAGVAIPAMTSGGGTGTGGPVGGTGTTGGLVGALPAATLVVRAGKRTGTGGTPATGAGDGVSGRGAAGNCGPLCLGAGPGAALVAPSLAPAAGLAAPPSWWRTVRRRRGRNAGRAWKALWSLSQMLVGLPAAGAAAAAGSALSACIAHKLGALAKVQNVNCDFYRRCGAVYVRSFRLMLCAQTKVSFYELTRSSITFPRKKNLLLHDVKTNLINKLRGSKTFRKNVSAANFQKQNSSCHQLVQRRMSRASTFSQQFVHFVTIYQVLWIQHIAA